MKELLIEKEIIATDKCDAKDNASIDEMQIASN